jgi:regulation of enolase protein 1 (concanavalin A-like superfamily)
VVTALRSNIRPRSQRIINLSMRCPEHSGRWGATMIERRNQFRRVVTALLQHRMLRLCLAMCIGPLALTTVGSIISNPPAFAGTTTTLYASPTGSGSVCSISAPCSLSGAQSEVQTLNSNMSGNIVILLSGGTYRLSSTWNLSSTDSATNGYSITWQAAPGSTPVITGGVQVTGWTEVNTSLNIWEASLPSGVNTRDLWVNGVRANLSQGGTLPSGTTQSSSGYVVPGNALQLLSNPTGLEFVMQGAGWIQDECGVSSVTGNTTQTTVTMDEPCYDEAYDVAWNANVGLPTQVLNEKEYLNGPNQFSFNTSTNKIDVIPAAGENMSTADAEVGGLATLIQFNGTASAPVTGVNFSGITFENTTLGATSGMAEMQANIEFPSVQCSQDWNSSAWVTPTGGASQDGTPFGSCAVPMAAAFEVHAGRNVSLNGNTFQNLGDSAITLDGGTQNSTVNGNVFTDVGGNGVQVGSVLNPNQSNSNLVDSSDAISNNYLSGVADEYQGGVGIWTGYTANVTIEHNDIENADYTGISTGWGWGSEDTLPSIDTGNQIIDNYITNTNRVEEDGGGIYNLGPQPSGLISGNYVLNPANGKSNYGVYLDAGSTGWSVNSNVVVNNAGGISWAFNNANSWDNCSTITFANDVANPIGSAGSNGVNSACSSTQTVTGLGTNVTTTTAQSIIDGAGLQASYQYLSGLGRNGEVFQTYSAGSEVNASFAQSQGTYTITAAGADVWGSLDQYGALYAPLAAGSSNTTTVEVVSQANTSGWAKAGIMLRNSITGAGSSLGYCILAVTPSNGVVLQWDDSSSGTLNSAAGGGSATAPIWLKLTRSGTTVTGYSSTNDSTWTTVGSATLTGSASTEDIGMFSDSQSAGNLGSATFANFSTATSPFAAYSSTTASMVDANNSAITIDAEGSDVWTTTDQYGSVYVPSGANSTSTTTVEVTGQDNTSAWAKAGIMLRNNIAGAGSSLGYCILAITPGNAVQLQWDNSSSGGLNEGITAGTGGSTTAPIWLRLTRSGTSVTGYYSSNDSTWTTVGSATLTGSNSTEDVGMFADSQDAGVVNQSTFSNFAITNAPFVPFASTPATITQLGGITTIDAGGAGPWTPNDQFGAAYVPNSADSSSVTTVEVDSESNINAWSMAGLMLRDSIAGSGSLGYCVLTVTPNNGVALLWDSNSGGVNNSYAETGGSPGTPIWLKLTRSGTSVSGAYSFNDSTWTTVATETLTGSVSTEDVGVFASSFVPGTMGQATFSNFSTVG